MKTLIESIKSNIGIGFASMFGYNYAGKNIGAGYLRDWMEVSMQTFSKIFNVSKINKMKDFHYTIAFEPVDKQTVNLLVTLFNMFLNTQNVPEEKLKDILWKEVLLPESKITAINIDTYPRETVYQIELNDFIYIRFTLKAKTKREIES